MTSIHSPGFHLYFDQPTPIFKARVNMASVDYPATVLVFDGVTLGAFGDLRPDMTLFLGSTDGAWDLGIVRVHNLASASEIPVGRVSKGKEPGSLNISDNAFITVFDDYRIWAKIPRMIVDPDDEEVEITTYKDASVPVLNYTSEMPPIANAGPFHADYIDDDTGLITVQFPMDGVDISIALAEGATIDTYDWDVIDGTITVGTSSDPVITATFPAGKRWVVLTVTDTNGVPHTSRAFVLAIDPDADLTYKNWGRASFKLSKDGTSLDVELNENLPRGTYPPGSLVLCWEGEPSAPGSRDHMRFIGWQEQEGWSVTGTQKGMRRGTTIHAVDVAGRMKVLPGFPQAIERSDEVSWETMPEPDMNRVLHYLLFWHTTAVSLVDIILPEDGDLYVLLRLDTGADDIFTQLSSTAKKMVPARILTCNPEGQLSFLTDWMEIDTGDRPAASLIIQESDIAEISARYTPQPRAHSLHAGALQAVEEWVVIGGQKTIPTLFAIAPGDAFSQGTNEVVESEGIALSQEALNVAAGHRYARMNSLYQPFDIKFATVLNYWEFAPAYMQRVQVNLDTDYQAQRGLEWENDSEEGMVESLQITLNNGPKGFSRTATLSWEMETEGPEAVTHIPEEPEDPDFESPTPVPTEPPPLFGDDIDEMAGLGIDGYLYRTFNFQESSPTWERFDLGLVDSYTWVVDPFSPKYLTGIGTVDAWAVKSNGIYRIEDIYGVTPSATLVHTFDVATDNGSFHWRTINASFGTYFAPGFNPWIIVVSYYGDTSGHEGTWARFSTDAGATWSEEVQLSADFGSGDTAFNPIALYTSPKTPGLAYTVARGEQLTEGLPHIVYFDDDGIMSDLGPMRAYNYDRTAISDDEEAAAVFVNDDFAIVPPLNTKRVSWHGSWVATNVRDGLDSTAGTVALNIFPTVTTNCGGAFSISGPPGGPPSPGATTSSPYSISICLSNPTSGTWPGTINQIGTGAGNDISDFGIRFQANFGANTTNETPCTFRIQISVIIDEVELKDGTIYTFGSAPSIVKRTTNWGAAWEDSDILDPGYAAAGTIHFPWEGNSSEQVAYHGHLDTSGGVRAFKLFKVEAGLATDVSPSDGSIDYGVNRGHFGVRAFDGDRSYLLAAVVGNDTSSDPADDQHAVYISDDGGATWVEVVAPTANVGDRPMFEAAFSGESEQVIFIWGPEEYFGFSTDFGATVQDKSGNLAALGHTGFIGIAGGTS